MSGLTQIAIALLWMGFSISISAFGQSTASVPVLAYHRFDSQKAGSTTIRTSTFEAQLNWLAEHHYRVVPLQSVLPVVKGSATEDAPSVAITVDDGHRSVYTEMFPIIRRRGIPVTLFIYPSAISNADYALTWEQLKEMKASGLVEIQSHTYWHPDFRKEKARLSPADYLTFVRTQLTRSKDVLERKLGGKVTLLAWPFGIIDSNLKDIAAQSGYLGAFAYEGGVAHAGSELFSIPRIPVSDWQTGAGFGALLHSPTRKVGP